MHGRVRLLAVLGALVTLAVAGGGAGATTLDAEPAGAIESSSLGRLTIESDPSQVTVACDVTLNGELDDNIAAVSEEDMGDFTEWEAENCTGGSMMFLSESLPWSLGYTSHNASVLDFSIKRVGFLITWFGSGCLYIGTLRASMSWTGSPHVSGLISLAGAITLFRRLSGLFNCPSGIRIRGSLGLVPTQTITEI